MAAESVSMDDGEFGQADEPMYLPEKALVDFI